MIDDPTQELDDNPTTNLNGHRAEPVPMRGPRMPNRDERWVTLPDKYGRAGMKVRVLVSYPKTLADDLRSDDEDRIVTALSRIILEHNGWLDEDGEPMPPLGGRTKEEREDNFRRFWLSEQMPQELALLLQMLVGAEVGKIARSVMQKLQR